MRQINRDVLPWAVTGVIVVCLVGLQVWSRHDAHTGPSLPSAPSAAGPARDVSLPGGGVSDGGECGVKGYHYFAISTVTDTGGVLPGTPAGPQMGLGAYGAKWQTGDPGAFHISFSISLLHANGSPSRSLDLSPPLGVSGVAVEIEGPSGLVGGAHNVPVTLDDESARLPNGKIRVGGSDTGLSVELTLPAAILCRGYDVLSVQKNLGPPTDSTSTITGQPPYTLTVSISDPAVTVLRAELGSAATGPVLAANNRNA
jgi:hypothetical protein